MNRQNYPTEIEFRKVVDSSGLGTGREEKIRYNGKGHKQLSRFMTALFLGKHCNSEHHFSHCRELFLSRIGYICHISQTYSIIYLRPV